MIASKKLRITVTLFAAAAVGLLLSNSARPQTRTDETSVLNSVEDKPAPASETPSALDVLPESDSDAGESEVLSEAFPEEELILNPPESESNSVFEVQLPSMREFSFSGGQPANKNYQRMVDGGGVIISWSKKNDELRGFSRETGEWSVIQVRKQKQIVPVVGKFVAAVRIGDAMAAYSGKTGSWDVLQLSKESKAVASLSNELVQTADGDQLYTFAAAKGKWTSPNDPNFRPYVEVFMLRHLEANLFLKTLREVAPDLRATMAVDTERNRVIVSGPKGDMEQVKRLVEQLDTERPDVSVFHRPDGQQMTEMYGNSVRSGRSLQKVEADIVAHRNQHQQSDARSLQLAMEFRKSGSRDEATRHALATAVAETFDARQRLQRDELERMTAKLRKIEENITARQKLRQRIIDRRVEELLDPNVDWETVTKPDEAKRVISVRGMSSFLSTKSAPAGAPLGVPGPPHIASGAPGGLNSSFVAAGAPSIPTVNARDLIERQQVVARLAEEIRARQKEVASFGDHSDQDSKERRLVNGLVSEIQQRQQSLKRALADWKQAWRAYESRVRIYRLELEESQSRRDLAETKALEKSQLVKAGAVTPLELQTAQTEFTVADIGVKRAEEQLMTCEAIAKESPHLNPAGFATNGLLQGPDDSTSDQSTPGRDESDKRPPRGR